MLAAGWKYPSLLNRSFRISSKAAELFLLRLPWTDPRADDLFELFCTPSVQLNSEADQGLMLLDALSEALVDPYKFFASCGDTE